jgi:hypothetical protein
MAVETDRDWNHRTFRTPPGIVREDTFALEQCQGAGGAWNSPEAITRSRAKISSF